MFDKHDIKIGDLVRLSIQYHLRTNNGYLRLYKFPTAPEAQRDIVSMVHALKGPSIDLTCPMQIAPLLYLGQKTFKDKMYGMGTGTHPSFYHVAHLFLFETTIYFWLTKDLDEDLFFQWFEPVKQHESFEKIK